METQNDPRKPHGIAPVRSLTPIRRLLAVALGGALLAVAVVVASAFHVMQTTDAAEMARERQRASGVADILESVTRAADEDAIMRLGQAAGLRQLRLEPAPNRSADMQNLPLLAGPQRGQYLSWVTARPGRELFDRYAPSRLPIAVGAILSVLISLGLIMRDMRRIEHQRTAAEVQAHHDHLTGLPNRLALELHMQRLASEGTGFSVLAMDLDRFKPINDLFGHHVGDQALRLVAARLQRQMLPEDVLARVGGDEFVAIVQRNTSRAGLAELALDCIHAVIAPMPELGTDVSVGISIGILADGLRHPSGAPLKLADRALYEAKRAQGCSYRFAGEDVSDAPETRRQAR